MQVFKDKESDLTSELLHIGLPILVPKAFTADFQPMNTKNRPLATMIGENRQFVTDEPGEFEK